MGTTNIIVEAVCALWHGEIVVGTILTAKVWETTPCCSQFVKTMWKLPER